MLPFNLGTPTTGAHRCVSAAAGHQGGLRGRRAAYSTLEFRVSLLARFVVTIPLPVATQDTAELIGYALRGVEQIFREGYRYQKAGVILTALVPAHQIQAHLFDHHDRERSKKLMAAIDTINTEWGSGTIRYAAVGLRPGWLMRCARRSPRYTTRWTELAVVR
jgi:DNA polymerase V